MKAAVLKMTKGAKIEEIERETEGGKTVYEVEASYKGVEFGLVFAEDGSLVDFEIEDEEDADEDDDEGKGEDESGKKGDRRLDIESTLVNSG